MLILYSQEARSYSMLTALTIMSTYFLVSNLKSSSKFATIGFVFSTLLGLYTHNLFLFVIIGELAVLILYFLRNGKLSFSKILKSKFAKEWLLIWTIIGVLYIPWFASLISQYSKLSNEGFWLTFDPINSVKETFLFFYTSNKYNINFNSYTSQVILVLRMLGLGTLFAGILAELRNRRVKLPIFSILLMFIIGAVWAVSFKTPFFYIRYLIFVLPLLLILNSIGFRFLEEKLNKNLVRIAILLFTISNVILYITNSSQIDYKADYTSAINMITFNEKTDIVVHPSAMTFHSFYYYSETKWRNYIYDPQNTILHYEGISTIPSNSYFEGDIKTYNRVWLIHLFGNSAEETLKENGFELIESSWFSGNLNLELWQQIR